MVGLVFPVLLGGCAAAAWSGAEPCSREFAGAAPSESLLLPKKDVFTASFHCIDNRCAKLEKAHVSLADEASWRAFAASMSPFAAGLLSDLF